MFVLSLDEIKKVLKHLGAEDFIERRDYLETNTICHNKSGGSLKLCYFFDSGYFHCYTECGRNYSIFDLVIENQKLYNKNLNFIEAKNLIEKIVGSKINDYEKNENSSMLEIPTIKRILKPTILKEYNKELLKYFSYNNILEWEQEGITKEVLNKFNIGFYHPENQITIPHFDVNGRLIGIRVRNLEEDAYAKYCPLNIGDIQYNHPLRMNLYGLNENLEDIKRTGTVLIFEGEKSVLKMGSFFDFNNSVATCNNQIGEIQLYLLLNIPELKEIVICFDKDYEIKDYKKEEKLFDKYKKEVKKANKFIKTSMIWDFYNELDYKNSPIDKGGDIFKELYKRRIFFKENRY